VDGSSRRLGELVRILDETSPRDIGLTHDTADHLERLRLQRIERLAAQLGERTGPDVDNVDAVAMRVILDEYSHIVADLRTAAAEGAKVLENVAAAVSADRRLLDERLKPRE
jgi:hypothetical protein